MKIRWKVILNIVIVSILVIYFWEYKRGSNNQIGLSDKDYGKSRYDNSKKDLPRYKYIVIIKLDDFRIGAIISVKEGNLSYEFFNGFNPSLLDGFKSDVEKGRIMQKTGHIDLEKRVHTTLIAPAESDDPLYILALKKHLSNYLTYYEGRERFIGILADEDSKQSFLLIDKSGLEIQKRKESLFELTHLMAFTDYMKR